MPDLDCCHECEEHKAYIRELRGALNDLSRIHKEQISHLQKYIIEMARRYIDIGGGLRNFPSGIKTKKQLFKDIDGNIIHANIPVDEDGKPIVLKFEEASGE